MTVIRKTFKRTNKIAVGDQISLSFKKYGTFTATAQEVTEDGVWFLFDECVTEHTMINMNNLLEYMKQHISNPSLRKNITFFGFPTYGQIFGHGNFYYNFEEDENVQWELMKVQKNRIADYRSKLEWYWLKNKTKCSSAYFALASTIGDAYYGSASDSFGVRPAFFCKIAV